MTGTICSVAGCKSNANQAKKKGERLSFFVFPNDPAIRKEWIRKCRRKDKFSVTHKRICSKHFSIDDFEDAMQARLLGTYPKKLKKTAVPSLNLLPESEISEIIQDKTERLKTKRNKKIVDELSSVKVPGAENENQLEPPCCNPSSPPHEFDAVVHGKPQLNKRITEMSVIIAKKDAIIAEQDALIAQLQDQPITRLDAKISDLFSDLLSPNQLQIALKRKTKVRWNEQEISKALALRYLSKRAYIYVRQSLKFPMPGISTLRKWASNIKIHDGILKDVLNIMHIYGQNKTTRQKLTVLSFAEMKVSSLYEYDQKMDAIIGRHKYMQVIMARGLIDNWKQPIFIGFDTKATKQILFEVIIALIQINYNVVACVSDCDESTINLWEEMDINIDKTYCFHPVTNETIYFFANVPDLLKSVRNWFVGTGFKLENGCIITKEFIEKLICNANSDHKLTLSHLNCKGESRQNVSVAAQLFSYSTASDLRRNYPEETDFMVIADFIELISSWCDIMNSYTPTASYDKFLDEQNIVLESVVETFKTMRCISKISLQTFQMGVIISTKSMQSLYQNISAKYDVSCILTHRLNQDCLENLFSKIRTRGGLCAHLSPLDVLYRIRMILLEQTDGITSEYVLNSALRKASVDTNVETDQITDDVNLKDVLTSQSSSESIESIAKISEKDGLIYAAGFLAKKFRDKYPTIGLCTTTQIEMPSWLQSLFPGGLIQPSDYWLKQVEEMDRHFSNFHNLTFKKCEKIVQETTQYIYKKHPNAPHDLIKSFVRHRILIRAILLNIQAALKIKNLKRGSHMYDLYGKSQKKIKK